MCKALKTVPGIHCVTNDGDHRRYSGAAVNDTSAVRSTAGHDRAERPKLGPSTTRRNTHAHAQCLSVSTLRNSRIFGNVCQNVCLLLDFSRERKGGKEGRRGGGTGRERNIDLLSTWLCSHWLTLGCALTGDQTHSLGAWGRRSSQLSHLARAGQNINTGDLLGIILWYILILLSIFIFSNIV